MYKNNSVFLYTLFVIFVVLMSVSICHHNIQSSNSEQIAVFNDTIQNYNFSFNVNNLSHRRILDNNNINNYPDYTNINTSKYIYK
jgi:ABC-type transport system involved in multi-copper enzyme maturation permease subunit